MEYVQLTPRYIETFIDLMKGHIGNTVWWSREVEVSKRRTCSHVRYAVECTVNRTQELVVAVVVEIGGREMPLFSDALPEFFETRLAWSTGFS